MLLSIFLFYAVVVFLSLINRGSAHVVLTVDNLSGDFEVTVDDALWFQSGPVTVMSNGILYSTNDKTLLFQRVLKSSGLDNIGEYLMSRIEWSTFSGGTMFIGNIREYGDSIVFEQLFETDVIGTSVGDANSIISSFPSFQLFDADQGGGLGYAHWDSWHYAVNSSRETDQASPPVPTPGWTSPIMGKWNSDTLLEGGLGGTGVTSIFNSDSSLSAVISPMNSFMVATHVTPTPGLLCFGVMGTVTSIPQGFTLQTVLTFHRGGVNAAMTKWGNLLRRVYDKPSIETAREKDLTLRYLGYTTDHGAYYYYHTATGLNYQDTLIAIQKYAKTRNIPYKYVLLDSWWYHKGRNGGVSEWTSLPDVFPNGVEAVYSTTGWLVQAHNRFWSNDTTYATQNGGAYEFIFDELTGSAVPIEERFWTYLLGAPTATWGLRVYEQDWLWNIFGQPSRQVTPLLESVSLGRMWLLQMGRAANQNGITVQYCMPHMRHILQSLEVAAVTQVRASGDYLLNTEQWRIGGQSILLNALGLLPSKDGYWSVGRQDGNPYGNSMQEPVSTRQAAVLSLSAGPVAVGDGIDFSDPKLIMRACMQDGQLLSPTSSAVTIDKSILQQALGGNIGPIGEVWSAKTVKSNRCFVYVFVSNLENDWLLRPSDVGLDDNTMYRAFNYDKTFAVHKLSGRNPLRLQKCAGADFFMWTIVPIESNGFSLQGEINKWISVSEARFDGIITVTDKDRLIMQDRTPSSGGKSGSHAEVGMEVRLRGVFGEEVEIGFVSPEGKAYSVTCTFGGGNVDDEFRIHHGRHNYKYLEQRSVPEEEHLTLTIQSSGRCYRV